MCIADDCRLMVYRIDKFRPCMHCLRAEKKIVCNNFVFIINATSKVTAHVAIFFLNVWKYDWNKFKDFYNFHHLFKTSDTFVTLETPKYS